jgi:uncharacterized peroxidase-related enzyme
MSRITILDPAAARPEAKPLLDAVQATLGGVPNFIKVLSNAPAALEGFLGLFTIAQKGALDPSTRERIALAVSEQNSCQYCVSVHTALAKSVGLPDSEIQAARHGTSADKKGAAAVKLARALVHSTGELSNAEFQAAKDVLSEEEILEVIAHVTLSVFTNMLGKSTRVEIDFPVVSLLKAA